MTPQQTLFNGANDSFSSIYEVKNKLHNHSFLIIIIIKKKQENMKWCKDTCARKVYV